MIVVVYFEFYGVGLYFVIGAFDGSVRVFDLKNWKFNMDMILL